jgi:hypothetical protein
VDLKEKLQQRSVIGLCRIESDFDRFGVSIVVAIGGVLHLAAGVADARRDHARLFADQVLHAPEATASQDCAFRRHSIISVCP